MLLSLLCLLLANANIANFCYVCIAATAQCDQWRWLYYWHHVDLVLFHTGFDLITQFQLDVIPLKGVRKVDGSTPLQVAYRLDKEANFQIPTM